MKQSFTVEGMTCAHCEQAIKRALHRIDGNAQIVVDRQQNKVEVDGVALAQDIIQAISDEGYQVVA